MGGRASQCHLVDARDSSQATIDQLNRRLDYVSDASTSTTLGPQPTMSEDVFDTTLRSIQKFMEDVSLRQDKHEQQMHEMRQQLEEARLAREEVHEAAQEQEIDEAPLREREIDEAPLREREIDEAPVHEREIVAFLRDKKLIYCSACKKLGKDVLILSTPSEIIRHCQAKPNLNETHHKTLRDEALLDYIPRRKKQRR